MTNTSDTIKLTCVTADNNNKYYNMMKDASGDTFTVEYGRINSTKQVKQYPISKWESIYRQKTAKGYRDVTNLFVDDGVDYLASKADSTASATTAFIMKLRDYARKTVKDNYSISTSAVTSMMIQKAQSEIDILANTLNTMKAKSDWNTSTFDRHLIDIYSILPRKMSNVKKFLAADNLGSDPVKSLQEIITREQDVLDALAATVATKDDSMNVSIFDKLGIEMREKDDDLEKTVKEMLGDISWRYLDCYYVKNLATQKRFDDDLKANGKASHKKTNLFWHGSRNENWLSILQNGLLIRPAGVTTQGAMFSAGLYFADKAKKSFGYTSSSSAYWTHGNSDRAYMAIFSVRTGKQYNIHTHTSECYNFSKNYLAKKGDYDSVYAHAGRDLRNNEFIVYDPAQATIHAIVELKA